MPRPDGYFDHNATTPLSDAAREAWLKTQEEAWENPSSLYRSAGRVRRLLEDAREELAAMLDVDPTRVVFTSGATEGNNAVFRVAAPRPGIAGISPVEHPSVREPAYASFGSSRVHEIPVDENGVVDPAALDDLPEDAAIVSVMAANNETGVVQPWQVIAGRCAERGIACHCDAAQWVGKRPLDGLSECAWITISAHKFGGPKGTGVLVIPADQTLPLRFQTGGPQESGHRAGTEDYAGIAAMLAALRERQVWVDDSTARAIAAKQRDAFETKLIAQIPGIEVVGRSAERLETTSMAVMPEHSNVKWVTRLGERGLCVSTGSACSSGKSNPSPVLQAMNLDYDAMGRVLRFSAGPKTDATAWEALLDGLGDVWNALQSSASDRPKVDLGGL